MNGWINVKDKLPEVTGPVLVCTQNGKVCLGRYLKETNEFIGPARKVVFWSPIPPPPQIEMTFDQLESTAAAFGYVLVKEEDMPW